MSGNAGSEKTASVSRALILVGAAQGAVLCWLWQAGEYDFWPAGAPMMLGLLLWLAFAVPALCYYAAGTGISRARFATLLAVVVVLYGALGIYAGWVGEPLEDAAESLFWLRVANGPGPILAAAILLFVLVPLVAGRRQGKWDYHFLFDIAWRNGLLAVSVLGVTILFWAVLHAGAMLLNSLGLNFLRLLIREAVFIFPVTGIVVGAVWAQGLVHSQVLASLRRYWMGLNAWLLPLLLLFGVMWVVALPFTGLEPLFSARSAAFILLWFTVLAVHFLNCAWQDGQVPPPYPRWLMRCIDVAWLSLVPVVAVAGYALWLRIRQYGWTEDRIWAAFIWLLATGYALGYSASWLKRGGWMHTVGGTNVAVAIAGLVGVLLLLSPVADPRRLAVNDQVARLMDGRVTAGAFDYHYLRNNAGQWGLRALQRLASGEGDVAISARQVLASDSRSMPDSLLSEEEVMSRLEVLRGPGEEPVLPADLMAFLQREGAHWRLELCLSWNMHCAIWLTDLNGDGEQEALLFSRGAVDVAPNVVLLKRHEGQWQRFGALTRGLKFDVWKESIESGAIEKVPPLWPDVMVEGWRVRIETHTWNQ